MPKGGYRPGAGRKPGTKLIKTPAKEAIQKAGEALQAWGVTDPDILKLTPLAVLDMAMKLAVQQGNWSSAAAFAKEAAPYMHSKLSSVDLNAKISKDVSAMSDDEILTLLTKHNAKLPPSDSPSATIN